MFFCGFFGFFLKFLIFYENNTNFSLSNRFFYEEISNKLSFIKKIVRYALKNISERNKSTLSQELIHILGERG